MASLVFPDNALWVNPNPHYKGLQLCLPFEKKRYNAEMFLKGYIIGGRYHPSMLEHMRSRIDRKDMKLHLEENDEYWWMCYTRL